MDLIGAVEKAHLRLISSSVMLVYEGGAMQPRVKLIDFAHSIAQDGLGRDEGVLLGLHSLAQALLVCSGRTS